MQVMAVITRIFFLFAGIYSLIMAIVFRIIGSELLLDKFYTMTPLVVLQEVSNECSSVGSSA